jgi:hypothetical protein
VTCVSVCCVAVALDVKQPPTSPYSPSAVPFRSSQTTRGNADGNELALT